MYGQRNFKNCLKVLKKTARHISVVGKAVGVSQANRSEREGREREGKVFNSFILSHSEKPCFLGDISSRIKLQTKPAASQTLCHTQLRWADCFLGFQESLPFPDWEGCFLATPLPALLVEGIPEDIPSVLLFLAWKALWHCFKHRRSHRWPQTAVQWTKAPSACSTFFQGKGHEGNNPNATRPWGSKVLTAKRGCVWKIANTHYVELISNF